MISCATGHRPDKLGGYSDFLRQARVQLALEWFQQHPEITHHIQGMALGWDQDTAEAALLAGIPVVAALPFRGQELRWPFESRRKYQEILAQCSDVVVVCPGGYAPWKMMKRNKWMVDECDIVLALHDGSSGGTGNCVDYANDFSVEIDNLWPQYQAILEGHYRG